MNYPKYYGNYLGIIVQNNDPEKRGRVKVFVPHISPTIYNKWNEISKDKKFKFIGANVCSDLTEILEDLKKILPWAEIASPLVGEAASGRYNAYLNAATISDSNDIKTAYVSLSTCEPGTVELDENSQNLDGIGEKPGNIYDISYYKLKDAFADPEETKVNNVNVFSYNYTPECYSNCAKGAFPLLRVGSHVWVFFINGDALKPVIFASSYGTEDWRSIHDIPDTSNQFLSAIPDHGMDYPGTYENISQTSNPTYDINTETYRNKYVINQKGGTIAFVNSDNREMLKLTHYSGSFKEFNNHTNIELATGNDQKLVLQDLFLTVRGTRNEYTELDYDLITKGDFFRKVGNLDKDVHEAWKSTYKEIAELKQLFDIQRSSSYTGRGGDFLTAANQALAGTAAPCPVCNSNKNSYNSVNNFYKGGKKNEYFPTLADTSGNYAFGPTLFDGNVLNSVAFNGNLGIPTIVSPLDGLGGSADGSTGENRPGMIMGTTCPFCNGSGLSPSSQDGNWAPDPTKATLEALLKTKAKNFASLEKEMGLGGSEIVEITKHKVETIGLVFNDFTPIRVDEKGKAYISEVKVGDYGTFYNREATPLVEPVHTDDMPSGNYTLTVGNKYTILVGAGGISMRSYGIVNVNGAITNISGEQVNLAASQELNIDGGKRVTITADVLSIKQRYKKQIVVDSNLGVTRNLTVAGGGHFEGEVTLNHITGPADIKETQEANAFVAAATDQNNGNGKIIGFGVPLYNYVNHNSTGDGKADIASSNTPAFIGVADKDKPVGTIKGSATGVGDQKVIGYIPPLAIATFAEQYGYPPGPIGINPVRNTVAIPIFAGDPGTPRLNGVNSSDVENVIFGSDKQCIRGAFGSKGSGNGETTDIDNSTSATLPIVIFGTGRDNDSMLVAPHSHLFKTISCTLKDANYEAREVAKTSEYSPRPAQPVANSPGSQSANSSTLQPQSLT